MKQNNQVTKNRKKDMKRIVLILCLMISMTACNNNSDNEIAAVEEGIISTERGEETTEASPQQEDIDTEEAENSTEADDREELKEVQEKKESLQEELARIEMMSEEHLNTDTGSMGQQQMNRHSEEWYQIWDDELNSLWNRLINELSEEEKDQLVEEQLSWIKKKEGNAKAAGIEALFGSLQPLLESNAAGNMTRARVYDLAKYLAEVRGEEFIVSTEIQENLEQSEINVEELFEKYEGQWIFDESRGACVGVERTEECSYGVEGSNWTLWIAGGDIFSDLDVYGYTDHNILFQLDSGAYYDLSSGIEGGLILTYMPSLSMEDYERFETILVF